MITKELQVEILTFSKRQENADVDIPGIKRGWNLKEL